VGNLKVPKEINRRDSASITTHAFVSLSGIHCERIVEISITYSKYVFVTTVIQHAMSMDHIVICGLSNLTIFFHITSYKTWVGKKLIYHKKCVLKFSANIVWNISNSKKNLPRYVYWHLCKVPVIQSDFNETWIFPTSFREPYVIKFHENSSRENRLVQCGPTDRRTARETWRS